MNKKAVGKFRIETPKSLWIDKLCILRAKSWSFVCSGKTENKAKLKGIKKPARDEIDYKVVHNCLMGEREYKII